VRLQSSDIQLLRNVCDNQTAHFCDLHHDQSFVPLDQVRALVQQDISLVQINGKYLRPFCEQMPHTTISIGCAHSPYVRMAARRVLFALAEQDCAREECFELAKEVLHIDRMVDAKTGLDTAMNHARDAGDTTEITRLAHLHHSYVERLLAIAERTCALIDDHKNVVQIIQDNNQKTNLPEKITA
jgi:hypothetical protein